MFRYLFSVISLLFVIISPCVADIASSEYVDEMRNNVQAKIDKKADNANYAQNMVLQTDNSGNVVATTVGTDLFADGAIETMHLTDGAVTNADLAGMIDIKKLNLGTLPTRGKHIMIWNATTNEYVFERYATSILPTGYTQLEYIESTGTQYIDTEYDLDTNNLTIKTKIREIGSKTGENDICGNQDTRNNRFVVGYYGANSSFAYNRTGTNPAPANATIDLIRTNDNEITYVYDGINQTKYIIANGIKGSEAVFSQAIYPSSNTIKIFQTGNDNYFLSCQIKYLQLISDDILVRNFIPAKRNSDGEVGMYDLVTNTFFTNSGTGEFIAGPEVE